ncbi:MAG: serine hydrolase domain-containing protein [Actinomycetota bacterium]
MMRRLLVTALLAAALSGCTNTETPPENATEIQPGLLKVAGESPGFGFTFAVVDSSGIIEQGAYGIYDPSGRATELDTLFHVGSTHKAINALVVATLVDDDIVDWDTALATVLDDPDIDPAITFRHLLTMSSGIPADIEDDLPEDLAQPDLADTVFDAVATMDPLADPGETFEYSNVSAAAAGYGAAMAGATTSNAHQAYIDLLQDRVLDPLGMSDSTVLASEAASTGRLSTSFSPSGSVASIDSDTDILAPSGSLKSTAGDMAHFLQMMLAGGTTTNGERLVSEAVIAEMWTPALENYAMGWEMMHVDGIEVLVHEGSFDGFLSIIAVLPDDDLGLVVLTNSEVRGQGVIDAAVGLLVAEVS